MESLGNEVTALQPHPLPVPRELLHPPLGSEEPLESCERQAGGLDSRVRIELLLSLRLSIPTFA